MRDYSKVAPQFWSGRTGKALKAKGAEAVIVALYLMTCQHANWLGLYYLSKAYIAVDTGLGIEGASKGLQWACEAGFCGYDEETEVVWVTEMACYQIAERLEPKDLRCKGVQKDYDSLPENPFLTAFYEKYSQAFHMTSCRGVEAGNASPTEAPLKPLASQEQEQEQEQKETPHKPPRGQTPLVTLRVWLESIKAAGDKAIPEGDSVFAYADEIALPRDFLRLAWLEFRSRYTADTQAGRKRYRNWREVFRKAVRENWLKLWWVSEGQYALTTAGEQARRATLECATVKEAA